MRKLWQNRRAKGRGKRLNAGETRLEPIDFSRLSQFSPSPILTGMSDSHQFPPFPRARLKGRWLRIGLPLWLGLSLLYAAWLGPWLAGRPMQTKPMLMPLGWFSPLGMLLPAAALSLLAAIWRLSPLPLRVLFGPTRARILGGLGLWLVWPLAVIFPYPLSAGLMTLEGASQSITFGSSSDIFRVALIGTLSLTFCYGAACLLSHAIQPWWHRLLSYALLWSAGLAFCAANGTVLRFGSPA